MSSRLGVVAAIPAYNMATSLGELLPAVLSQGYDRVVVADDASRDDGATRDVLQTYRHDITAVFGRTNLGSGGNRNRLLAALAEPDVHIHFLDADVRLVSTENPAKIQDMDWRGIGFIGGLVLDDTGKQSLWNYGPQQCLHTALTSQMQAHRQQLPAAVSKRLTDWPDPDRPPQPRRIFWPLESNMIVRSALLRTFGGFNPRIREHDIQQPALRAHQMGYQSRFDPTISVMHRDITVRPYNRSRRKIHEEMMLAQQHGWLHWLLPDGHFRPRLNPDPGE